MATTKGWATLDNGDTMCIAAGERVRAGTMYNCWPEELKPGMIIEIDGKHHKIIQASASEVQDKTIE